jgi:hypothetical protein
MRLLEDPTYLEATSSRGSLLFLLLLLVSTFLWLLSTLLLLFRLLDLLDIRLGSSLSSRRNRAVSRCDRVEAFCRGSARLEGLRM